MFADTRHRTPAAKGGGVMLRHLIATRPVLNYVRRICRAKLEDWHDADDAAQDTMLRLVRTASSFDPSRPWQPWVATIAARICWTRLERRRRRDDPLPNPNPSCDHDSVVDEAVRRERIAVVRQAVEQLDEHRRELVRDYYGGALLREIAARDGVSFQAVQHRLRTVHRRLAGTIRLN